ncbi:A24 family peptidase [Pectobacterium cacticida]|uniref:A24 family peptidase n=1 Tax=Pectobacterium cacticida TaxID=69221 RepID=UPI002FEEA9A3
MVFYAHALALVLLVACLCWCISTDLLARRIPNLAIVLLLAAWGVLSAIDILHAGSIDRPILYQTLKALPGAGAVLVIGFLLFLTGRLGAGDVKLMSVLCLWVGSKQQITFVMITALAGGVLALGLPLLNAIPVAVGLGIERINQVLKCRLPLPPPLPTELSQGIPYGIAIAFGAMYVLIFPLF